jgi:hypothetical protein
MHGVKAAVGVAFGALALFLTTKAVGPAALAQTAPGGPPALAVSAAAVVASGMSPGGKVVWLGMARKVEAYEPLYVRRHGMVQADAQGKAQLPVTEAVPRQSIWAAIDLKTGAYATASPTGFVPLTLDLGAEAVEVRGAALADRLVDPADYGEVLLVRPGKGAWGKAVGRGGADDESAPGEEVFRLAFDKLLPVPGTTDPSPGKLSPKDLIFVIHPRSMGMAVVAFDGKP